MLPLTAFLERGLLPELLPGSSKRISSFFKMDLVPLSRAVTMFSHPPILHPLSSQNRSRKQSGKHCRLLVSSLGPSLSKLLCHVPASLSLSQWPHASPHVQSLSKSSRFYCKCIPNPATCHPSPAVSGAHRPPHINNCSDFLLVTLFSLPLTICSHRVTTSIKAHRIFL